MTSAFSQCGQLYSPKEKPAAPELDSHSPKSVKISIFATQIYTASYLILFSILGTLARLGLETLTQYDGAPVTFSSAWPNFAGSLLMGFLSENRLLFRNKWETFSPDQQLNKAGNQKLKERNGARNQDIEKANLASAKAQIYTKKTIPLYIGLTTGLCGSFTSFSSFIRDIFLALSDDMDSSQNTDRDGGLRLMALIAVFLVTTSLSLSALFTGAHLAILLEPCTPNLQCRFTRLILDRLVVIMAAGSWVAAILLSSLPPDRSSQVDQNETWRDRATISICLAPLGCLCRFYLSLWLNSKSPSFPVGTFIANIVGTALLGLAWDLQHSSIGGFTGCQVSQGIMDGFCGCLTTVSTFAIELTKLKQKDAYVYGGISIFTALSLLIGIIGGLKWSQGFSAPECVV